MIILQEKKLSSPAKCHYLPDEIWQFEYFFATELTKQELDEFLRTGWRKFGYYYFRPACDTCNKCLPLRVKTSEYRPTKSQRRVLKRNSDLQIELSPLRYSEKIFEIYQTHSINRFGKPENSREDFISSFYSKSCPAMQSLYYLKEQLIGVGFIDITETALSSVYYIFDTDFSSRALGTYSIIKEIELAEKNGLEYYYLGYYIEDCPSMAYKAKYTPYELYDWERREWR